MFDVHGCLKPSRTTFHSALLFVSPNSCHAQTVDCPPEGKGIYWHIRYKKIDLIAEYNHFTWECKHLATFPPSSLETVELSFVENVNVVVVVFKGVLQ